MFGFFINGDTGLLHGLDGRTQAALVTRSLVLVNNILVGNTVDDADVFVKDALSSSLVTAFHGLDDLLDRGAQSGTQARVMCALLDRLAGAFSSLSSVCHGIPNLLSKCESRA